MKLNNKGFAISTIMYLILVLALILIALTLAILSNRKLVLDKIKDEVLNNIYPSTSECIGDECDDTTGDGGDDSEGDDSGGNTGDDYSDYYCRVQNLGNNNNIICGENDTSVLYKTYTMVDYSEGTMCYYMIDEFEPGYNFSSIYGSLQNIQYIFEANNVIITPALPRTDILVEMGYCWEDTSSGYNYSCSGEYVCSGSYWIEGVETDKYALTNIKPEYGTCSIGIVNDESIFETLPGFRYMIGIELSDIGGFTGDEC